MSKVPLKKNTKRVELKLDCTWSSPRGFSPLILEERVGSESLLSSKFFPTFLPRSDVDR